VVSCITRIIEKEGSGLRYGVRAHSGGWVWVLDHARLYKDVDGQPLEMVGSWLNVTEREEVHETLKQREEAL